MNLLLTRLAYGPEATTGWLTTDHTDGNHRFYTIEQPWHNNIQDHSCVPDGTYKLVPYDSPKHGPTWCLHNPDLHIYATDPPNGMRGYCEVHSANWAEQLKGCIALGLQGQPMLDPLTGHVEPAVEGSRDAIAQLLTILGPMSDGHVLIIEPSEGVIGARL